jgi:hypothetical protein
MTAAVPINQAAKQNLLGLVQTVCAEIAIDQPLQIVGNRDSQVVQLLALANREGRVLAAAANKDGGLQALRQEYIFSTVSGTESYVMPLDINFSMPNTFWDRSLRMPLIGPLSPAEWQTLKSGIVGSLGPRTRYRVMGNMFYLNPLPSTVSTLVYEYYSTGWCQSLAGTAQNAWAADTDYYSLDDDCMVLGVIWRYLSAKGLAYAEQYNEWMRAVDRYKARTGFGGMLALNAGCGDNSFLLSNRNIPDGGFGA